MNLTIETALHGIACALRERIAPAVTDPFASEAARLAEMLLTLNANWIDDAAAIRIDEIRAIKALFADAGSLIAEPDLGDRLADAAALDDPGLRISELDRACNDLRALLTVLHARLEEDERIEAKQFGQKIWRKLAEFEAARAPRP